MENSQRDLNAFRGGKAFGIPSSDLRSSFFPNLRLNHGEDALGILKEHPLVSLEHADHVFAMLKTEVVKGGASV